MTLKALAKSDKKALKKTGRHLNISLLVQLRTNIGRNKLKEIKDMIFSNFNATSGFATAVKVCTNILSGGLTLPPLVAPDSSTYRFKKRLIEDLFEQDEIRVVVDELGCAIGSIWKLDMLLRQHISVILGMDHLLKRVEWFVDDAGRSIKNFWVVGVGADGFPRNKQSTKATEMGVQLLNLGGLSNCAKWTLLLFGLDAGEGSEPTVRCLKEVADEMTRIEEVGIMINNELHKFKFLNKADLKFWHDFNRTGGCAATYFLPWYNVSLDRMKIMDAVILPRNASEEQIEAAGGIEKVYFEYDYTWNVAMANEVETYRQTLEASGLAATTIKTKVHDFCRQKGHSLFNGVPYCKQALEGVPDPLHVDCNEMKELIMKGNEYCEALAKHDTLYVVEEADFYVGATQREYWNAMGEVGLKQEQGRLENKKIKNPATRAAAATEFRVTGTKTTITLLNFYKLTDALGNREDMETDYERFRRGALHLSFLFLRIMSSLYNLFKLKNDQLDKMGTTGRHLFALKVLLGYKVTANEHTLCYAIHHRLKKYSKLCQINLGKEEGRVVLGSLGGGVLGSCQGLEGKHWFTRASMACNTSMRKGVWSEEHYNSGIRMVYGEREVPVPVNYGKYKHRPRIPVLQPEENKDQCVVCRKYVLHECGRLALLTDNELEFAQMMVVIETEVCRDSLICSTCSLSSDIFFNVVKPRAYGGWCEGAVSDAGLGSSALTHMSAALDTQDQDALIDTYDGGDLWEAPTLSSSADQSITAATGTSAFDIHRLAEAGLPGVLTVSTEEILQATLADAVAIDRLHAEEEAEVFEDGGVEESKVDIPGGYNFDSIQTPTGVSTPSRGSDGTHASDASFFTPPAPPQQPHQPQPVQPSASFFQTLLRDNCGGMNSEDNDLSAYEEV